MVLAHGFPETLVPAETLACDCEDVFVASLSIDPLSMTMCTILHMISLARKWAAFKTFSISICAIFCGKSLLSDRVLLLASCLL